MRIGIDARMAHYRREGGIAQYTLRLAGALARQLDGDELVVLHHRADDPASLVPPRPGMRARPLFTPPHHRWEQWVLPVEVAAARLDLLHCPDFIPPFHRACPAVITVHDLAFRIYPELLTAESARYYGQIDRAVRSAEQIIAVSEATRADMLELLAVDAAKITVIHEAADPAYRSLDEAAIAPVLAKHSLSGPFILAVGTIEPRKNLPLLLRAFAALGDAGATLVIAGRRGWLADDVFALADTLGACVRFLGPVPADELAALYNAAHAFAMPSRYEGFGLPVVEAMACGAPVIVSNISSLPEIAGDAGLALPPDDEPAWRDALRRALDDADWHVSMRARSLARAAVFSWDRAASETLAVYRKAVTG
ncbi:MAG: glycosyltransferase family 4 protein [Chloroflexi bacterium]|nr:glycosyltransferase family 4 protein [Chloroflexota bacterium]